MSANDTDDRPETDVSSVDPRELYDRIAAGERVRVLDVRDRDEFEAWRVDGPGVEATQVPYAKFVQASVTDAVDELADDAGLRGESVVVVCARGEASAQVAGLLADAGVEAHNLAGGMEGWARVYVGRRLDAGPGDATVIQYERPSSGCLSYLIVEDGEAVAVDPLRAFADHYAADAAERGADVLVAVDTHVHADHVSGVRAVCERTGATAVLPAGASERGLAFEATLLGDGEAIAVGGHALRAIHAPGHTTESTALRFDGLLFTGDALFLDGVGRPDLESGADGARTLARRLYRTLHDRLLALPGGTAVAPGHVEPARAASGGPYVETLAALRGRLDLLDTEEATFVERVGGSLPDRPVNYEEIIAVNLGREDVDGERAFELELGPNNCAVGTAT